jgi:hypothetical protein
MILMATALVVIAYGVFSHEDRNPTNNPPPLNAPTRESVISLLNANWKTGARFSSSHDGSGLVVNCNSENLCHMEYAAWKSDDGNDEISQTIRKIKDYAKAAGFNKMIFRLTDGTIPDEYRTLNL